MPENTKLLKHFAVTDGLVRGTAIVSSLITIAAISILPGFGTSGLLIASTIQMFASGILEIPSGVISDRYGVARAVRIALFLKLLVTGSFLAAVISAQSNETSLVWIFFTLEAIIDSLANTFLSGSYQAAYLKWYKKKYNSTEPTNPAPPLFLASMRHGLAVRFLLPLGVLSSILFVHFLNRELSIFGSYDVAYLSIGIIFMLRVAVWLKTTFDLNSLFEDQDSSATKLRLFTKDTLKKILSSKEWPIYSAAVCVNMISILYLLGQVFKKFLQTGLSESLAWASGIAFGTLIYFVRTAVAVWIFPKLGNLEYRSAVRNVSVALFGISILSGALLSIQHSLILQLAALMLLAISTVVFSDAIIRLIDSNLGHIISEDAFATWISFSNSIGMLAFGFSSAVLAYFSLENVGVALFCLITAVLAAFIWFKSQTITKVKSTLATALWSTFSKSLLAVVVILAFVDILFFSLTYLSLQRKNEDVLSKIVLQAVTEPLSQGSYPEAIKRLKSLSEDDAIYCSRIDIWDLNTDLCQEVKNSRRYFRTSEIPIHIGDPNAPASGSLTILFDKTPFFNALISRILFTTSLFFIISLILSLLFKRFSRTISSELDSVVSVLSDGAISAEMNLNIHEFAMLARKLRALVDRESDFAKHQAHVSLAKQVAHDIRSPLSALNFLLGSVDSLSEEKRVLARSAITRINDISNNLLVENRAHNFAKQEVASTQLLSSLIDSLVSEKRLQYRSLLGVSIDYVPSSASYGLFATVQPMEFKRLLSNIINNAVEALPDKIGRVQISLSIDGDNAILEIVDNGKGIAPEIMPQLGQRGVSFGKHGTESGSGLGLYHARTNIESWGGKLDIQSDLGIGTRVLIYLPQSSTPRWFLESLQISEKSNIVVVDDDVSIHRIWDERFKELQNKVSHFSNPEDLRGWILRQSSIDNCLFLVDYEFLGQKENGLDLIESLGISDRSILVTSHFDEPELIARTESLKLSLLPKNSASLVPIQASSMSVNNSKEAQR